MVAMIQQSLLVKTARKGRRQTGGKENARRGNESPAPSQTRLELYVAIPSAGAAGENSTPQVYPPGWPTE